MKSRDGSAAGESSGPACASSLHLRESTGAGFYAPFPRGAGTRLAGPAATRAFLAPFFAGIDQALLVVIFCSAELEALGMMSLAGAERLESFPMAAILREAARTRCAGLVLAHNHNRDGKPRVVDCGLAQALVNAAEPLDITILDVLLFGEWPTSLREAGLL